ncbi:MAG TPA: aminotransferase class I/II-fold pyridoxal phosphate-dependent enzyme [Acidocella sp.]|uniref:aminotransferase class I/II-fold pyridoxal phosphate-dependent enzyme n=1 Tax=Acidocella sp. TaxID=50710 RepID=UPI002BE31353|nr:aminotransferase class I/II-fold pyridoxal phosphate-dependent enzyme [Acidocella sp.]HVE20739.1 aminotransferase class I/II-fold pyridoxal phosphate-dependent enzyme [Acidocella sp.]
MNSLEQFAAEKLSALERRALRRQLQVTSRARHPLVERGEKTLISFSCNDYLSLSVHPAVIEAAVEATRLYGVGAGASRLVTGNHPLYAALEARLAAAKGTEDSMVFGAGYLANSGIIPALIGQADAIFVDELAHACIWAGAKLSAAKTIIFRHNDMAHLAELLAVHRRDHERVMIATDTVFSMDGDLAPVAVLADLAEAHDAWLMTDDAHGLGVVPKPEGAGRVPLQMGTLSKAIGAYGGYICASENVVALLRNRARSFVYTTGLPPGTVAAAIAALDFIAANPGYAARPLALAGRFTAALGLPEATSPIVPLIVGGAAEALNISEQLQAAGFLVTAIRPPTVPEGTARLRFTFTAAHQEDDLDRLAATVKKLLTPRP